MRGTSDTAGSARATTIHQDEILTGEAVALDVQPVGFFLRALSALIDMVAGILLLLLLVLASTFLFGIDLFDPAAGRIVVISTLVLVMVVVPTAVETATRGRSLGRLAVGARIVRTDGGATGFRHAFIRALVGVLELWFTAGAIAAVVGIFTPRAQRLGDLLAGTYAERTRTPPLPVPAPGLPPALAEWAEVADVARLPDRLARRIAQFARQAANLEPHARQRAASALAREAATFVSPMPAVDPETFVCGVAAIRRERELAALTSEDARALRLASAVPDAPRGFPER